MLDFGVGVSSGIMKLFLLASLLQCMSIAFVAGLPVEDDAESDVPPTEQHSNRFTKTSEFLSMSKSFIKIEC